jgi:hypothetical protein
MLILTDDGPLNCDDARHAVRDMRTGRPPSTAQQLARDDRRLTRMVRDWAASKRHAQDCRSTKDTHMPRFNASALFQHDPDSRDLGPTFAHAWESRHSRRQAPRKASRHAFDAEAATEAAIKHLEDAKTHLEVVAAGRREFDAKHFERMLRQSMQAMAGAEEENAEDDDPDHVTDPTIHGGPPNVRAKDGGKDGVGEVPPESVVRPSSRPIDHRKDFNDIKQGGADSALFDPQALFQRGI